MNNYSAFRQHGQGMVELIVLLSLLSVTLSMSFTKLNDALTSQHNELNKLRAEILQPIPTGSWQRKQTDEFSSQVKPILAPLNDYTELKVKLDNLHFVTSKNSRYILARLTDDWQLDNNMELISSPRSLTLSHYLHQSGLSTVLDVIGGLPISRELKRESLVLGKVDSDITPYELRCKDPACR